MVDVKKKDFQKMFPRLAQELTTKEQVLPLTSIRSDIKQGEKAASKEFDRYTPDVIDFLRRCDTEEQAEDIWNAVKAFMRQLSTKLKENDKP